MHDNDSPGAPPPFRRRTDPATDRERKREVVLLAAVRMFNARGFQATSLDDLAASLGVTKPTIYHYLGNKDQVLLECLRRGLEQLEAAAGEARAQPGTGLDRLRMFLCRYIEIGTTDFGRCSIRTDDSLLSADSAVQYRGLKRRIDTALRDLIAEAVADGSVDAGDPRITGYVLAGVVNWVGCWYRPGGTIDVPALARDMVDRLLLGLVPRQGADGAR